MVASPGSFSSSGDEICGTWTQASKSRPCGCSGLGNRTARSRNGRQHAATRQSRFNHVPGLHLRAILQHLAVRQTDDREAALQSGQRADGIQCSAVPAAAVARCAAVVNPRPVAASDPARPRRCVCCCSRLPGCARRRRCISSLASPLPARAAVVAALRPACASQSCRRRRPAGCGDPAPPVPLRLTAWVRVRRAAKSAMVKSISWPTPVTTGMAAAADGARHALVVEAPQVFDGTAAARHDDHIAVTARATRHRCARDDGFGRRRALHRRSAPPAPRPAGSAAPECAAHRVSPRRWAR